MNQDSNIAMWVVVSTIILVALTIVTLAGLAFKQLVVNTIVDQPAAEERMIILDNEEVIPVEEPTAPVEEPVSEPVEEEIVINTIEVTTITYTVVKGDSLWKIASELLDDPTEWPTIWGQNADQIEDPDLIFPGQVLTITLTSASTASIT